MEQSDVLESMSKQETPEQELERRVFELVNYGTDIRDLGHLMSIKQEHMYIMETYDGPKDGSTYYGMLQIFKWIIAEEQILRAKADLPEGVMWAPYNVQ